MLTVLYHQPMAFLDGVVLGQYEPEGVDLGLSVLYMAQGKEALHLLEYAQNVHPVEGLGVTHPCLPSLHPDHPGAMHWRWLRPSVGRGVRRSSVEHRAGTSEPRTLVVSAHRLAPTDLVLVLEDVTELRRLRQIRTEFIDNLGHELRTPLSTVTLLAETLAREAEIADIPPRMRERLALIEVDTTGRACSPAH